MTPQIPLPSKSLFPRVAGIISTSAIGLALTLVAANAALAASTPTTVLTFDPFNPTNPAVASAPMLAAATTEVPPPPVRVPYRPPLRSPSRP